MSLVSDGWSPILSRTASSAFIWIEIPLCICFVVFRTWIQFRHNKRFYINDYLIISALLCHIAAGAVYQFGIPSIFTIEETKYDIKIGIPLPSDYTEQGILYLRLQFVLLLLFWTTLWTVKFSLLFFFWRVFESVRSAVKTFWWVMCFITASTYLITIFLQLFACGSPGNFFEFGGCQSPQRIHLSNIVFQFSAGTDIACDIFILLIPFPLLRKLQVSKHDRNILILIFLTPLIPVGFGIVRLVFCTPEAGPVDVIKFQLYSLLENSAAIITACLPSFRLFIKRNRHLPSNSQAYTPPYYQHYDRTKSCSPQVHRKSDDNPGAEMKGVTPFNTIPGRGHSASVRSMQTTSIYASIVEHDDDSDSLDSRPQEVYQFPHPISKTSVKAPTVSVKEQHNDSV